MEPYSAWHALISSATFIWYLLMAVFILGLFFKNILNGVNEYISRDKETIAGIIQHVSRHNDYLKKEEFAGWRIDIQDLIMELKHSRNWADDLHGDALTARALMKALSYLKALSFHNQTIETIEDFYNLVQKHQAFIKVSGEEAQRIANRGQLAFAIHMAKDKEETSTAALVIPGGIYPGTAFENNNPMILWFGQEAVMELQAAAAFGPNNRPVYYAVKNLE